nr:hypothetical protein FVER53263_05706 [Fusarium verticillioides]
MPPQPHSVLMHLLQSGEYSDFILRCKDREFKLHQMIVCPQSPVISAALNGGFEETTSKVIAVNEFDLRTVRYMVNFLYSADYRLAPHPETKPAKDENREEGEVVGDEDKTPKDGQASQKISDQTAYQIVSHLRVNAIADYYGIEKLAKLSTSKIESILKKEVDFHIIPEVIAEMSAANRDLEIRSVIATATARYIAELASTQALRTIDLEHQLTIEILEACGKRVQKLLNTSTLFTINRAKLSANWRETGTSLPQRKISGAGSKSPPMSLLTGLVTLFAAEAVSIAIHPTDPYVRRAPGIDETLMVF